MQINYCLLASFVRKQLSLQYRIILFVPSQVLAIDFKYLTNSGIRRKFQTIFFNGSVDPIPLVTYFASQKYLKVRTPDGRQECILSIFI